MRKKEVKLLTDDMTVCKKKLRGKIAAGKLARMGKP